MRLDVVLVFGDRGPARHLDRLVRQRLGLRAQQPVGPPAELLAVGGVGRIELVGLDLRLELLDALKAQTEFYLNLFVTY